MKPGSKLWCSVFTICILSCQTADPVSLGVLTVRALEQGTLFLNQAQHVLRTEERFTAPVRFPQVVHFYNGRTWFTYKAIDESELALGAVPTGESVLGRRRVTVHGVSQVAFVCNDRLLEGRQNEAREPIEMFVPENDVCAVMGVITRDGYPSYYAYQSALQPQVETLFLTPDALFAQDLSIGTAERKSFVQSFLTIRGLLTSIPLGQGIVDESSNLVLLSPESDEGLGVFVTATNWRPQFELPMDEVSIHLSPEVTSARLPWGEFPQLTPTPGTFDQHVPWNGEVLLRASDLGESLRVEIKSLYSKNAEEWVIHSSDALEFVLPERPRLEAQDLENVSIEIVWFSGESQKFRHPGVGEHVSAYLSSRTWQGMFRSAPCQGTGEHFSLWSNAQACDGPQETSPVWIDECGRLLSPNERGIVVPGTFDSESFSSLDGRQLPYVVDGRDIQVLDGVRGFQLKALPDENSRVVPDLVGHWQSVALYEQIFEEGESGDLVPLGEEFLIRLQPPMSFPALNITPGGEIMVRLVESQFDLRFVSSQPQANGFEAERIHPICDGWQESFALKQTDESLILEHVLREQTSRIVYGHTYRFTP